MTSPREPEIEPEDIRAWLTAPDDETGAVVRTRAIVFQDSMTAITVTGLVAYSTGFALTLNVLRRVDDVLRLIELSPGSRGPNRDVPEEAVQLEVEYADGRRASNLDGLGEGPSDIRLTGGSGGGGGFSYNSRYWAWPLPPPGPLKLAVAWQSIDLPLTEIEIDARLILDAAAQSERLWKALGSLSHSTL